jgi:hypothetical protein
MLDKPLHVQVAEALGWTYLGPSEVEGEWEGEPPPGTSIWDRIPRRLDQHIGVPRYDTEWSATGPLIEEYGIELARGGFGPDDLPWLAAEHVCSDHDHNVSQPCGMGPTPLIAVCNLILALKAAGKL